MMLIEAILFSLIIGLIRGGKLKRFRALNHRTIWLLILGMLLQYMLVFLHKIELIGSLEKIVSYSKEIMLISYILILAGIFTNIKFRSLWLTFAGFLMNFIAFAMNNWKIPILAEGTLLLESNILNEILETGPTYLYTPIAENIKNPLLGNIIIFSNPYPISKIISLGDVVVAFGIFALIQEIMLTDDSFMGGYSL